MAEQRPYQHSRQIRAEQCAVTASLDKKIKMETLEADDSRTVGDPHSRGLSGLGEKQECDFELQGQLMSTRSRRIQYPDFAKAQRQNLVRVMF